MGVMVVAVSLNLSNVTVKYFSHRSVLDLAFFSFNSKIGLQAHLHTIGIGRVVWSHGCT